MAKTKRKSRSRYCRLDKRERKAIEHGLDRGDSCRSMARDLGGSASTVHDEVVRNRVVAKGPGRGENVTATDGSQSGGAKVCPKLLSWPYCCNGRRFRRYHCVDDLDVVDAWFVGPNVSSEPRPSLMGLSPLALLRAAEPAIADALADRLGIVELPYDELDLTLGAVNRERSQGGWRPWHSP